MSIRSNNSSNNNKENREGGGRKGILTSFTPPFPSPLECSRFGSAHEERQVIGRKGTGWSLYVIWPAATTSCLFSLVASCMLPVCFLFAFGSLALDLLPLTGPVSSCWLGVLSLLPGCNLCYFPLAFSLLSVCFLLFPLSFLFALCLWLVSGNFLFASFAS